LTKSTQHWLEVLDGSGIPFGPVNTISETFNHPQVLHRSMVQEISHPKSGNIKVVGIPVKYSQSPCSIRDAPPTLGQHTEEILRNICNYSARKIEILRREKVI
jgi:succinate--hydroxymethylglutarate CoA-transferase